MGYIKLRDRSVIHDLSHAITYADVNPSDLWESDGKAKLSPWICTPNGASVGVATW
jgi:hypothetical protein